LIGSANQARLLDVLPSDTRVTMAGFDGATGAVTLHFATRSLDAVCLPSLAEMANVAPSALMQGVRALTGTEEMGALPTRHLAVSYSDADAKEPPVLTLGFDAPTLLGDDAAIAALLHRQPGFGQTGYRALIETLPPAAPHCPAHGTINVTARADAETTLSIGVAAPWTSADLLY